LRKIRQTGFSSTTERLCSKSTRIPLTASWLWYIFRLAKYKEIKAIDAEAITIQNIAIKSGKKEPVETKAGEWTEWEIELFEEVVAKCGTNSVETKRFHSIHCRS
jgi:hypothetical protein